MDYNAFVSSTFVDLRYHRAHVIQQLRRAGFDVDPMEDWTSSADAPRELSRRRLDGCHLCVLLVARRRGHVPEGERLSITQMEYEEAKRRNLDILPFVLDDKVGDWPSEWDELSADGELRDWRAELFEHRGVARFDKDPRSIEIGPGLTRWVKEEGPKVALLQYLQTVRRQHGVITFVSLPRLEDHVDAPIQRLYIEPTVAPRRISADVDPREWPATIQVLDAIAENRYLVMLGDPGSGKSTLVSWIAWQLAEHHYEGGSPWTTRLGHLVPLPLVLRELDITAGVTWDELLDAFVQTPIGRLLTLANLKQLLQKGRVMIMLDGLDEIGNPRVRRDLRDAIRRGMGICQNCHWLVTSRIVGYDEVPVDCPDESPFGSVIAYSISVQRRFIAPFDDQRVNKFAQNWFVLREATESKADQRASELLEAVRADEGTRRLGRIPNLLTIMALIYRIRARLPDGRALLYNEIAQAYLETIDFWRGINVCREPLPEKRRWLSRVGFEMQRQRAYGKQQVREILASGEQVRQWIAAAMNRSDEVASHSDSEAFVDFLAKRSGLLMPRGEDRFAFMHLSFQEYFAACFLMDHILSPEWLMDQQQPIALGVGKQALCRYAQDANWRETLVFLIELLAAEWPVWLKPVCTCLFGDGFADVCIATDAPLAQVVLLARLAVNPHTGFSSEKRQDAIKACCAWEAERQQRVDDPSAETGDSELLTILFSADPESRDATYATFFEAAKCRNLTGLNLGGTPIRDLTRLHGIDSLQWLNASGTEVVHLAPLMGLENLRWLELNGAAVTDLSPLAGLTRLQVLGLGCTPVADLSPLTGLQKLKKLDLRSTLVTDLSPLVSLENLEEILVVDESVTAAQIEALRTARRERGLGEVLFRLQSD